MRVIPVIDLLKGQVVHAIRGRRHEYNLVKSILSDSTDPISIAAAFQEQGFRELYIADLDSILGSQPNFSMIEKISDITSLKLMVDAGINDINKAKKLRTIHATLVVGTETLPSFDLTEELANSFGGENVVISLDLNKNIIIGKSGLFENMTPISAIENFQHMGISQFIVLDLQRVGSRTGLNFALIREIVEKADAKIFVGGGVRDMRDLLELERIGVFGVLVATALHSGHITSMQLQNKGLL